LAVRLLAVADRLKWTLRANDLTSVVVEVGDFDEHGDFLEKPSLNLGGRFIWLSECEMHLTL